MGDEPWRRRKDWAEGRVRESGAAGAWVLLGFAIFWNAIAWTGTVVVLLDDHGSGEPARFLILLFPAIGLLLAAAAVYSVAHRSRYGVSLLELATIPGPPGRLLAGEVMTRAAITPLEGFRIQLSCVHRTVTGSGKNRTTHEDILWRDERRIPGAIPGREGIRIPFALPIPADARETDDADPRNAIVWRLSVDAEVPGVDYRAGFEVPVFRTAESDTPLTPEELAQLDPAREPTVAGPDPRSGIEVLDTARGLEIRFPAGRAPGAAHGFLVIAVLWSGLVYLLYRFEIGLVFVLAMGFFGLVLLLGVVQLFLVRSVVVAERGALHFRRSLLGLPLADRHLQLEEVSVIEPEAGFRAGSDTTWDLAVRKTDGTRLVLGRNIARRTEAEWLANELMRRLRSPG